MLTTEKINEIRIALLQKLAKITKRVSENELIIISKSGDRIKINTKYDVEKIGFSLCDIIITPRERMSVFVGIGQGGVGQDQYPWFLEEDDDGISFWPLYDKKNDFIESGFKVIPWEEPKSKKQN